MIENDNPEPIIPGWEIRPYMQPSSRLRKPRRTAPAPNQRPDRAGTSQRHTGAQQGTDVNLSGNLIVESGSKPKPGQAHTGDTGHVTPATRVGTVTSMATVTVTGNRSAGTPATVGPRACEVCGSTLPATSRASRVTCSVRCRKIKSRRDIEKRDTTRLLREAQLKAPKASKSRFFS